MKAILYSTVLCLGALTASSKGLDSATATGAIIGEAGNQPFKAQVAIACVIRNRGSLRGIYGANNPVVVKASDKVRARALAAWEESAKGDVTHGLKYFGCPGDADYFRSIGLHPAMQIGAITFWK